MSAKCLVIGGSFFFILLIVTFAYISFSFQGSARVLCNSYLSYNTNTLSFVSIPEVVCDLSTPWFANRSSYYHRPSLESFLQASKTDADQDLRLSGLAVVSRLANASESLVDVSKSRIHVDKIALVTFMNDTAFSCGDLALNGQNAGYSVVIYFGSGHCGPDRNVTKPHTQEEILIPIVFAKRCAIDNSIKDYDFLTVVDKTVVNMEQGFDQLIHMAEYLKRLYFWFLVGPIITLEWLRRKKKLCCVSISQQVEESAAENEENARLVPRVDEDQEQTIRDITGDEIESESQPLIITIDTDTDITTVDPMGRIIVCVTRLCGKSIRYFAVGLGYMLLTLAALPVGISSGGLSYFRFDVQERFRLQTFWDVLLPDKIEPIDNSTITLITPGAGSRMAAILPVWWSVVRIFSIFTYSTFVCKRTWAVSTNPSKLIRSDWFSSNMYLLVLCFVVPYCSLSHTPSVRDSRSGSLHNVKLTGLRTAAIGLTLTLSFSSSMHIIRKLMKPQESVFEGLSEK